MRKLKYIKLIILFFGALTVLSCSKGKDEVDVDLGYEYYPLAEGNEWIYDIESIEYNTLGEEVSIYQLKEVIGEKVDGGDEENYLIHRFKREDETEEWVQDSVWSVKKEANYLVKSENNIRYQKLVFPVGLNVFWDGNIWNTYEENIYKIVELGVAYSLGGETYADVLEVEQKVENNLILSIENREYYAKNIGLIEFYKKNIETQPGENQLGSIYHQVLKSYKLSE